MEQYKIREDGFAEIRKSSLKKAIPISVLAISSGVAISFFNSDEGQFDYLFFIFLVPLFLVLMAFGLNKGLNRQKKIYETYLLTIDDNGIKREQFNTPTVSISKENLNGFTKNSNGSIVIKGISALDIIYIPSQIDDSERLENSLLEMGSISSKSKEDLLQKYQGLLSLVTMALMAAVYISKDKIIVVISGSILLFILVRSFIKTQRSKNIDNKTKKGKWWLILVIASIVGVVYFKLTDQY